MNLRWSILHFFIYIVQICWNLDTVCTGFHANLHYPFIFHSPFSILNFPFCTTKNPSRFREGFSFTYLAYHNFLPVRCPRHP